MIEECAGQAGALTERVFLDQPFGTLARGKIERVLGAHVAAQFERPDQRL